MSGEPIPVSAAYRGWNDDLDRVLASLAGGPVPQSVYERAQEKFGELLRAVKAIPEGAERDAAKVRSKAAQRVFVSSTPPEPSLLSLVPGAIAITAEQINEAAQAALKFGTYAILIAVAIAVVIVIVLKSGAARK